MKSTSKNSMKNVNNRIRLVCRLMWWCSEHKKYEKKTRTDSIMSTAVTIQQMSVPRNA